MPRFELSKFCFLFPDMDPEQYDRLRDDIKENGVSSAIVLWHDPEQGKLVIVDGRHRDKACSELGIECPTREFKGTAVDVAKHVISLNLSRRHLNAGQIAMAWAKANGIVAVYRNPGGATGRPKGEAKGSAYEIVGKEIGVSPATVNRATHVLRESPEKAEEVLSGKKGLIQAVKEIRKEKDDKIIDSRESITDADDYEGVETPAAATPADKGEPTTYQKMLEWNRVVEDWAKAALQVGQNPPDGIDTKTLEIINAHLRSAASTMRAQKGHATCSYCDGEGCQKCNQLGWLNKVKHESVPPAKKRGAA